MTDLRIAPELALPVDAVTETFALLAKRGAGKSNAAVVMAEAMYDAGLPWIAVDPKGDWWGIRTSADGKGPGLPVPILGGEHGDAPLEAAAGREVARFLAEQRVAAIVDVSTFSKSDMRRFLADFADELYRRNREPLHVFAEEAHEYIPQRVDAGAAVMVGAWEKLVKWGRTHGLGVTLITQRSASLNKDVLTQVETLIALRTTGPQDQAAIKAWVDEHESGAAMIAQIRKLDAGEAFVLSPQWLELDEPLRIKFNRRRTFDSGATPKAGQKRVAARTLADVDLGALTEAMAATIEKAKADDPKVLRARIRELELEVANLQRELATSPVPDPEIVEVEKHVLDDDLAKALDEKMTALAHDLSTLAGGLAGARIALNDQRAVARPQPRSRAEVAAARVVSSAAAQTERAAARAFEKAGRPSSTHGDELTKPMQRVLDAIAWLEAVGFPQPTKLQTGFIAEYRVGKKVGGTFGNVLGQLRGADLITYPSTGAVALTDAGRAVATPADIERTTAGLQQAIFGRLAEPEARVLAGIVDAYPDPLTKQAAGERAGYAVGAKVGGTFGNILGRLRSLGLVDYPAPGQVVATDVLFLDGGRA